MASWPREGLAARVAWGWSTVCAVGETWEAGETGKQELMGEAT